MGRWSKYSLGIMILFCVHACKQDKAKNSLKSEVVDSLADLDFVESDTLKELIKPDPSLAREDYDKNEWAELLANDSTVVLDLRYASANNFTKQQIYDCPRCFLRPVVYQKLLEFIDHMKLNYDLGVIMYDCYRPRPYQQKLWDIVPDEKFVGNPAKGSMHNRGMAVDIGLIDVEGEILDMGTDFDHFGRESFHMARKISKEAIKNRQLLKKEIGKFGFMPITSEWWHYSYRKNIGPLSEWLWPCP